MIHRIIIFAFILNIKIIIKAQNCINKIIPKEIEHGILHIDNWQGNDCNEYFINITDYNLYEENIFEISTTKEIDIIRQGQIYTLSTNLTIDEIKNNSIIPKDLYKKQDNSYKIDPLTGDTYFFMPFQKTSYDQKYFIILIIPNQSLNEIVYYSISKRIPTIKIKENENKIFSHILNSTNDTHLYYKFELDKDINLKKYNLFAFIDDISKSIFLTNLSSLISYNSKMFIIEKNKSSNISEFFVGIKNREKKKINITINLYENDFYYLNGNERINQKIFFEHLNCNNKYYIIENYYNSNEILKKYLIVNRLYGNFSLKYYSTIKNINFEEYETKENGIEIINNIEIIEESLNIFILTCKTPSSFAFEFFSDDVNTDLLEGQQFKTYLRPNTNFYKINLKILNDKNNKYLFYLSIFDIKNETSLNYIFDSDRYKNQIKLEYTKLNITEVIYNDFKDIQIKLNTDNGAFIYYYLTSNRLFYNIVEGETFIADKDKSNLAIKIKKDNNFDYISFEAESEYEKMNLNYELKIINFENIEYNKIFVPLPEINKKSESNKINFHISNPYNKFDSSIEDDNRNYFYLLINFPNINKYPIYVNVKYIYNKNIITLKENEHEIIKPGNEYEIYGDKNYLLKDKIFFNINKCDYSKNYSFTNYYENNNNIIIQNNIINNREKYLTDNLYSNSKFIIKEEVNDKNNYKEDNYSYPSNYYNKGDIYLNYFLVNEQFYNTIEITNDFSIKYKDKMRKTTNLYWNEYIIKGKSQYILTNYSIYILPLDSPVNTICQLSLIPSNISILNSTNIDINIEEGNYKIAIVASVIDKEFPIITMYDILNLNVTKRINIVFIVFSILIVLTLIAIILYFYFRKKKKIFCFKRKEVMFSSQIEENKLLSGIKKNDEMDVLNKERINKNNNTNDKKSVNDTEEDEDENED